MARRKNDIKSRHYFLIDNVPYFIETHKWQLWTRNTKLRYGADKSNSEKSRDTRRFFEEEGREFFLVISYCSLLRIVLLIIDAYGKLWTPIVKWSSVLSPLLSFQFNFKPRMRMTMYYERRENLVMQVCWQKNKLYFFWAIRDVTLIFFARTCNDL